MQTITKNIRIEMPNLLLVAGNGRNVGKTYFACKIISSLAKTNPIIGVKISPHFHSFNQEEVIFETDEFTVIEEKKISKKDSSLMLQAGAKKVFFIMAKHENLKSAFYQLQTLFPENAIICESGGLHEFVNPGVFLFVKRENDPIVKSHHLKFSPTIIENNGSDFNFNFENIHFYNNSFSLANHG